MKLFICHNDNMTVIMTPWLCHNESMINHNDTNETKTNAWHYEIMTMSLRRYDYVTLATDTATTTITTIWL